ncbi:MAG: transposase [Saprospiraceae bacterium]|nr:transposase [Candidatus Brachybacter algidus]
MERSVSGLVTYERFNQTQNRLFVPLLMFFEKQMFGSMHRISFIDSTTLNVCHIKEKSRTRFSKVLRLNLKAQWAGFFGFKLHLIINDKGELLNFYLSKANVDDRNQDILSVMVKEVSRKTLRRQRIYI